MLFVERQTTCYDDLILSHTAEMIQIFVYQDTRCVVCWGPVRHRHSSSILIDSLTLFCPFAFISFILSVLNPFLHTNTCMWRMDHKYYTHTRKRIFKLLALLASIACFSFLRIHSTRQDENTTGMCNVVKKST